MDAREDDPEVKAAAVEAEARSKAAVFILELIVDSKQQCSPSWSRQLLLAFPPCAHPRSSDFNRLGDSRILGSGGHWLVYMGNRMECICH